MEDKNILVEIWGDVIKVKDLVISIIISSILAMGAYSLAPADKTRQLFYGLAGAVGGFIISALLIKPKRNIIRDEKLSDNKE